MFLQRMESMKKRVARAYDQDKNKKKIKNILLAALLLCQKLDEFGGLFE